MPDGGTSWGYVPISRKLYDSDPFWKEKRVFSRHEAWEDMIQSSAWQPYERIVAGEIIQLDRGEVFGSVRFFAKRWGWEKNRVARYLELLKSMERIRATREYIGGTAYLLVNYETYNPQRDSNRDTNRDSDGTGAGQQRDKVEEVKEDLEVNDGTTTSVALVAQRSHLPEKYDAIKDRIAAVFAEVVDAGTRMMTAEQVRETQAEIVFAYWAGKLNHKNALLDAKRLNRIKSHLRANAGNIHELLFVIDGTKKDDHLMGRANGNRKYDGIETIFRDRGQIERLSELGGFKPGIEHPMAQKYAALVKDAP